MARQHFAHISELPVCSWEAFEDLGGLPRSHLPAGLHINAGAYLTVTESFRNLAIFTLFRYNLKLYRGGRPAK